MMNARDSLEIDTRVVDAPDEPREKQGHVLDDPQRRREESAELRQRVEGDWDERPFKVDREELGRFDLKRAGLPDMSIDSAAKYVEQHRASRPWLAMTDRASPEAARIIAAMDAAGGHAHIRHEGWVTEEANRCRVAYREDPAQLDRQQRHRSIDGLHAGDQRHRTGEVASRIADPDACATAFARGIQDPRVREALERPTNSGRRPSEVAISISDLLGPDGYRHCTGWRLEPVGENMDDALRDRGSWVGVRTGGRVATVSEPQASPVPTFQGGEIVFAFTRNNSEQRYEVVTMFPRSAQQ
jgi:hypothetical protein